MKSLGEVAADLELDTFTDYAKKAGLWRTLEGSVKENYTLFAPSEEAFASKTVLLFDVAYCNIVRVHVLLPST